MEMLHHPAFQSFVLPFAVALLGAGLLKAVAPRLAALAAAAALLVALSAVPGWSWPASSAAAKLPWIVAAATVVALATAAARRRRVPVLVAGVLWLGASAVLAPTALRGSAAHAALALAGLVVLLCLLPATAESDEAPHRPASGPAVLAVASLGLAGVCTGTSLLLAQLAVMIAAACAGIGLWMWPRPRIAWVAAAAMPPALAWLAVAQSARQLADVGGGVLAVLALAFVAAPLAPRLPLPGRRTIVEPLAAAVLAALPVVAAVALQATARPPAAAPASQPGAAGDDDYYAPRWK